jgi:predicted methyltransferase
MHENERLFNRPDFLNNAMNVARMIAAQSVAEGDTAVDATAGNGHDTVLLAGLVGSKGKVWAFDVQQSAIDATWARCAAAGFDDRVALVNDSHAHMDVHVPLGVACVMFNLGYLPGADKTCTTQAQSTLVASQAALRLLKVGGCVLWVAYPGHDGGNEERALAQFLSTLDQKTFNVCVWRAMNQAGTPPVLFGAQRRE